MIFFVDYCLYWIVVVQVPDTQHALSVPGHGFSYGGRGPGRIVSPGEVRPSQLTGNLSLGQV
jgi:hypothetical protein